MEQGLSALELPCAWRQTECSRSDEARLPICLGIGWVCETILTRLGLLRRFVEQLPADQHAPDLAGAGADLVEFGVAQQAADRIVVDVAVAAELLINRA